MMTIHSLFRLFIIFSLLLLLWEAVILMGNLPPYILPNPLTVFSALYHEHNIILTAAYVTLLETVLGLMLGLLFGVVFGGLLNYFTFLSLWFLPILIISQALPTFAIAPLFVIWLGYGLSSKILTTTLMIFFPIASTFYDGLKSTDVNWLNLARTMNASKWRIFYHIRLPAALPKLASGIRIAAVSAPMGAIIGEWVGSSQGLGYLMINMNARMQIDTMFACLILVILMSLAFYFIVDRLLKYWITWA